MIRKQSDGSWEFARRINHLAELPPEGRRAVQQVRTSVCPLLSHRLGECSRTFGFASDELALREAKGSRVCPEQSLEVTRHLPLVTVFLIRLLRDDMDIHCGGIA